MNDTVEQSKDHCYEIETKPAGKGKWQMIDRFKDVARLSEAVGKYSFNNPTSKFRVMFVETQTIKITTRRIWR